MLFIKVYLKDSDFFSIFYCYFVPIFKGLKVYFVSFFGFSVFFECYFYTGASQDSFFVLFLPFLPILVSIYFSSPISSLFSSKTTSSLSSSCFPPYFLFFLSTFLSFLVLGLLLLWGKAISHCTSSLSSKISPMSSLLAIQKLPFLILIALMNRFLLSSSPSWSSFTSLYASSIWGSHQTTRHVRTAVQRMLMPALVATLRRIRGSSSLFMLKYLS